MANVKTINVSVQYKELAGAKEDLLVLGVFESAKMPNDLVELDRHTDGSIKKAYSLGDFTGKSKQSTMIYCGCNKCSGRILLLGLGVQKDFELDVLRKSAALAVKQADKIKAGSIAICLDVPKSVSPQDKAKVISEGLVIGRYEYVEQFSEPAGKLGSMKAVIVAWNQQDVAPMKKGAKTGIALAEAQNYARYLGNKTGAEINPVTLANEARKLARKVGLKCKIFDDKELTSLQMGGILAVGQGSATKPRMIMLEYTGNKSSKSPDVVIVGKAITFDSGGISLKPGAGMHEMKFDKCGGCDAFGIMQAVSSLKLKKNVVALIPSAENMPDSHSYRPGDIIKTYSGKTVEIQNTDAEGRMILCDAISYAVKKLKPKAVIDMATLTGACIISLGHHKAALFSNNDTLVKELVSASETAGEPVWHMPCDRPYADQLKSDCADLRNIGGREGGSATAAAFLREFAGEEISWAHIDIAGVAWTTKPTDIASSGATGYIVRTVAEYLSK